MTANDALSRLVLASLFAASSPSLAESGAQAVPRSFVASPEIYKVIAENEQYRVIAATWKPGQRDNWHSHGAPAAGYNVTDCTVRLHTPDGKFTDITSKAGDARVGAQVASHSLENTGRAECRLIMFEPK